MKKAGVRLLTEFLESPERPDGTLRFHELQGFLFAMASAPETIPPSEWLPLIGNGEGLSFSDENEAQAMLDLVTGLYNEINMAVLERSNALPAGCAFDEKVSKNFEDDSSISQWSRGFAAGHDYLSELWEFRLIDELDEECGATLMVLSFFGSRKLANAFYAEIEPARLQRGDRSFDDFAATMRKLFPDALASYANLGRSIFEADLLRESGSREPAVSNKIGRNEPCPCGSGKKYKRCCGGAVH